MVAVLPCGKVLVAGGYGGRSGGYVTAAELWDPATGSWSDLPPMAEGRFHAGCCVLPSGRVVVTGGLDSNHGSRRDGAAFDPVAQTWQFLPPMVHNRWRHGVVAVPGGLVAVGGAREDDEGNAVPDELFDESSGRWFELPHPMAEPRAVCRAALLPASALAAPAAAQ